MFGLTLTRQVAVKPPSVVVTVIVVLPTANALTKPVELTEAILSSNDDQVTALFKAVLGLTIATRLT